MPDPENTLDQAERVVRERGISPKLIVTEDKAGNPTWHAVWRHSGGKPVKKRVGPARLVKRPEKANPFVDGAEGRTGAEEARGQASWRLTWEETRKGPGKLSAEAAQRDAHRLVVDREVDIIETAAVEALEAQGYDAAPTVAQAADAWLKYRSTRGKGLRPTTKAEYKSVLAAHILPALGDVPVADVTRADVLEWREDLREKETRSGDPLSPRTVNKTTVILSGVFATAMRPVDLGGFALRENPCKWVERLPEDDEQERDPLTPEEVVAVAAIMRTGKHRAPKRYAVGKRVKGRPTEKREPSAEETAEMKRQDEQDAALILTLAFCGMRSGEAAALRWKHVVFAESRVRVERGYSAGEEGPTKGRERRWTLLPDQVAEPLAKMSLRPQSTKPDDLVFVGAGGSYMDVSAFRKRFKKAVKLAGIEREVRVHDMRHGATTDLRSVFDADAVRKLVGHKDARTAQRYSHARDQADAASKWSAYLAQRIGSAEK